uniref:Protein ORF86 n=1 Tax=Anguillid herpesvirus 1 TaxID=150286 RepID=A0A8E5ANA0_9VIRU|nr:protein ORF86 [Anguillid herpesvirus 1]
MDEELVTLLEDFFDSVLSDPVAVAQIAQSPNADYLQQLAWDLQFPTPELATQHYQPLEPPQNPTSTIDLSQLQDVLPPRLEDVQLRGEHIQLPELLPEPPPLVDLGCLDELDLQVPTQPTQTADLEKPHRSEPWRDVINQLRKEQRHAYVQRLSEEVPVEWLSKDDEDGSDTFQRIKSFCDGLPAAITGVPVSEPLRDEHMESYTNTIAKQAVVDSLTADPILTELFSANKPVVDLTDDPVSVKRAELENYLVYEVGVSQEGVFNAPLPPGFSYVEEHVPTPLGLQAERFDDEQARVIDLKTDLASAFKELITVWGETGSAHEATAEQILAEMDRMHEERERKRRGGGEDDDVVYISDAESEFEHMISPDPVDLMDLMAPPPPPPPPPPPSPPPPQLSAIEPVAPVTPPISLAPPTLDQILNLPLIKPSDGEPRQKTPEEIERDRLLAECAAKNVPPALFLSDLQPIQPVCSKRGHSIRLASVLDVPLTVDDGVAAPITAQPALTTKSARVAKSPKAAKSPKKVLKVVAAILPKPSSVAPSPPATAMSMMITHTLSDGFVVSDGPLLVRMFRGADNLKPITNPTDQKLIQFLTIYRDAEVNMKPQVRPYEACLYTDATVSAQRCLGSHDLPNPEVVLLPEIVMMDRHPAMISAGCTQYNCNLFLDLLEAICRADYVHKEDLTESLLMALIRMCGSQSAEIKFIKNRHKGAVRTLPTILKHFEASKPVSASNGVVADPLEGHWHEKAGVVCVAQLPEKGPRCHLRLKHCFEMTATAFRVDTGQVGLVLYVYQTAGHFLNLYLSDRCTGEFKLADSHQIDRSVKDLILFRWVKRMRLNLQLRINTRTVNFEIGTLRQGRLEGLRDQVLIGGAASRKGSWRKWPVWSWNMTVLRNNADDRRTSITLTPVTGEKPGKRSADHFHAWGQHTAEMNLFETPIPGPYFWREAFILLWAWSQEDMVWPRCNSCVCDGLDRPSVAHSHADAAVERRLKERVPLTNPAKLKTVEHACLNPTWKAFNREMTAMQRAVSETRNRFKQPPPAHKGQCKFRTKALEMWERHKVRLAQNPAHPPPFNHVLDSQYANSIDQPQVGMPMRIAGNNGKYYVETEDGVRTSADFLSMALAADQSKPRDWIFPSHYSNLHHAVGVSLEERRVTVVVIVWKDPVQFLGDGPAGRFDIGRTVFYGIWKSVQILDHRWLILTSDESSELYCLTWTENEGYVLVNHSTHTLNHKAIGPCAITGGKLYVPVFVNGKDVPSGTTPSSPVNRPNGDINHVGYAVYSLPDDTGVDGLWQGYLLDNAGVKVLSLTCRENGGYLNQEHGLLLTKSLAVRTPDHAAMQSTLKTGPLRKRSGPVDGPSHKLCKFC